uniref:Uncharacterized protein n=1 Tax=Paracidobacterium acidisoli TaxID=2303751 RepID=A0A372IPH5_9BACT
MLVGVMHDAGQGLSKKNSCQRPDTGRRKVRAQNADGRGAEEAISSRRYKGRVEILRESGCRGVHIGDKLFIFKWIIVMRRGSRHVAAGAVPGWITLGGAAPYMLQ